MEVLKEKQKCSPESVSAAGFTLIEIMTALIVVGVLATVAFHSYSRYKESSQFETYSYNVVLGMNSARAEARALSRKVRLCAGFLTMVEDLRNERLDSLDEDYGHVKCEYEKFVLRREKT